MTISLRTPAPADLPGVLAAVADWQTDGLPVQLHPGDLGWAWQVGAAALAGRLRVWTAADRVAAVGLLDGPTLLRLALDPDLADDGRLAAHVADAVTRPAAGVLPAGSVGVEVRLGPALRERLRADGWGDDEPWTSLVRDLADPVPHSGRRVKVVGPGAAADFVRVHQASFGSERFTAERWHAMAAGPAYAQARSLLAHDGDGTPVAAATVWSAGPGRPGLIEPLGADGAHRSHGHGRAIALAAAWHLRDLGSSTATVCTPSSNAVAVATYTSAGMTPSATTTDLVRPAEDAA